MSDSVVDWSTPTPAPAAEGASDGAVDSNSGAEESQVETANTTEETREVGVSERPESAVAERAESKPPDSKSDTDTKRTDIQEPKEKAKSNAPRMIDVNGEMISESELITRASKVQGSDKRFEEAARVRKQQQAFLEALKTDPMAVLSDSRIDIDRKALAEKWLIDELEREAADPRDVELDKYRSREAEEAKVAERRVEQEKQQDFQRQIDQKKTEVADVIYKAMENTVLSKSPQIANQVLREMAMYMRSAKQQGVDVTPDELVQHVESSRYTGYHALANGLEGEELIGFLGKDVVNKIRRADLKRLKGSNKAKENPTPRASKEKTEKKGERMDPYESLQKLKF